MASAQATEEVASSGSVHESSSWGDSEGSLGGWEPKKRDPSETKGQNLSKWKVQYTARQKRETANVKAHVLQSMQARREGREVEERRPNPYQAISFNADSSSSSWSDSGCQAAEQDSHQCPSGWDRTAGYEGCTAAAVLGGGTSAVAAPSSISAAAMASDGDPPAQSNSGALLRGHSTATGDKSAAASASATDAAAASAGKAAPPSPSPLGGPLKRRIIVSL